MLKVRLKFDCFQMSMNKLLPIIKFNEPSKNARSVEVKYHKRNEPTLVAFFIVMLVHFDICNSIFFFSRNFSRSYPHSKIFTHAVEIKSVHSSWKEK